MLPTPVSQLAPRSLATFSLFVRPKCFVWLFRAALLGLPRPMEREARPSYATVYLSLSSLRLASGGALFLLVRNWLWGAKVAAAFRARR